MAIDADIQPYIDALNARITTLTARVLKLEGVPAPIPTPVPTPVPVPVPGTNVIPYPRPGTYLSKTTTFTAAADGDVIAYFVSQHAGIAQELGLLVNPVITYPLDQPGHVNVVSGDKGIQGLNSSSSKPGDKLNFGAVKRNDILVFYDHLIGITDWRGYPTIWYSNEALLQEGDKTNHLYATSYFSMTPLIPSGVYLGWEDGGGQDYNKFCMVVTNVIAH